MPAQPSQSRHSDGDPAVPRSAPVAPAGTQVTGSGSLLTAIPRAARILVSRRALREVERLMSARFWPK
jgi:hypothetical protein